MSSRAGRDKNRRGPIVAALAILAAAALSAGVLPGATPSAGRAGEKAATRAAGPVALGTRRELLVDRHLLEKLEGARLTLHRPVAREVVITHDKPWEGNTCGYHTVLKDGETYRMYYRGWHHRGKKEVHPPVLCCAESRDGIKWTRPELGLLAFKGSKKNNIVWNGRGSHNVVPFIDANPARKPDEKYKAIGGLHREGGLFAYSSADGLRWKLMSEKPVFTSKEFAFDSQNVAFWDALRSEYRLYYRAWRPGRKGYRDVAVATSKDFIKWSKPRLLRYPGAPAEHLYVNQIAPYYRAPHLYLGFPTRYLPARQSLVEGLFMSSRDGLSFRRWGEAIIRPGLNRDRWHNRSNYIWLGMVETKADLPGEVRELSLYSNENYYKGKAGRTRRYTYRIDGFVSLNAPLKGGTATTRALTFKGDRLRLNVSTSAAGAVRVGIRGAGGGPIKGFALADCPVIYGDGLDRTVKWKGGADLAGLAGRAVRLHFELKDADIYSFRFAENRQANTKGGSRP
jgi:hypothetical protein